MGKTICLLHSERPLSLVIICIDHHTKVITDVLGLVVRNPVVIYLLTLPYLVLGPLSIIVLQQLIDSIVESIITAIRCPFQCTKGCFN